MYLISQTTKVGRKNTKFNSSLVSFLLDRLRSPRLVRLSGTRNSEIREYSKITENQRALTLKIHVLKEKIGLTFEPAIIFSSLVILYIAITYLGIPSSSILLFMVITVRLVPIIRTVLVQKQSINKTKGSIESIDSLLLEMKVEEKQSNSVDESAEIIKSIKSIQLKNVSYRYLDTDSEALSNVSLTFNKGTLNAIIGPSGSGKSTLIDIISGYRNPSQGRVYFDKLEPSGSQINNLVSYVPQQPQIFDGQIIEHISYGMSGKSLSDVIDATILSGAHDFIMEFDDQYQAVLNNNGDNLSGGQRYKIDMARALLSDAPILILDEPTSALDYKSKDSIVATLKKIKKETSKIIIVITHDFSIMPVFDSVVLLEDGKITAQSAPTKLKSISSWYANGVQHETKEVSK
jgi:ABC-type bacteriocin/lantibiotic exporter with double-glycine peptidase domain